MSSPVFKCRMVFHQPNSDTSQFGILEVNTPETGPSKIPHHIILVIDRSGSMAAKGTDGMSKMEHVQHTIRNMLSYIVSLQCEISVSLVAFDDQVETIAENLPLTEQSLKDLIEACDRIRPLNRTDIGGALVETERLSNLGENPVCIVLTDGCPTSGVCDTNELKAMVPKDAECAFIGYGTDHNANLMVALSEGHTCENYFVDSAENAGSVYGEILHGILYLAGTDLEVKTSGCKIYDWKSNSWGDRLSVPKLPSGVTKVFHLSSKMGPPGDQGWEVVSTPRTATLSLLGEDGQQSIIEVRDNDSQTEDLTRFILRQQVLETMSNAASNGSKMEPTEALEAKLKNRIEQAPEEKLFIDNLLDDLYVTQKSIESPLGEMFRLARHSSQGDQRAYNIKNIEALVGQGTNDGRGPLPLLRSGRSSNTRVISQADHSPYAAPSQIGLMRQCSAPF